jgi:hypothetical protein
MKQQGTQVEAAGVLKDLASYRTMDSIQYHAIRQELNVFHIINEIVQID